MGRITTVLFPLSFSLSLSFSVQICNNNSDRYEPEESNTLDGRLAVMYRGERPAAAAASQAKESKQPTHTTVPADYTIPNVC
jgi:hypothetical protein